jgi:hypothetical protein
VTVVRGDVAAGAVRVSRAYGFLIRSSHPAVQYVSWTGFASPARTKYRRICAQQ